MNIALQIAAEFRLDPPKADQEEFHALGDRLMDELLKLEGLECNDHVRDSTVSTDFENGTILVEMLLLGDDMFSLTKDALDVLRTAISTVEVGTPVWPKPDELVPVEFRPNGFHTKPVDVPAFA